MMNDDPIDVLERELVGAAHRVTRAASSDPSPPIQRRGRSLRRTVIAAAVLVPVIIVVAVALLVHSNRSPTPSVLSSAGTRPRTVLAVLRRPGTAPTGQGLAVIERMAHAVRDPTVTVEQHLLRQIPVSVAPGATDTLDLAVVREATGHQLIGITAAPSSQNGTTQMMYAYATRPDQAYATVGELRSRGVSSWLGEGPHNTQDYAVLVPDGVTRVRLDAPGQPTATVHDNVAGFRLTDASPPALSRQLAMTWLGHSGRVIRRVSGATLPSATELRARVDVALKALRSHLDALRQPDTAADRAERQLVRDAGIPGMTVIASSTRIARSSRYTGPIVVALVRETSEGSAGVLVFDKNGGGPVDVTQLLRSGSESSSSGQGRPAQTIVLVPNGVTAVALTAHGRTTRATVRNNIALIPGTLPELRTATTWYGAHGQLIKRIPPPVQ